MNNGKKHIVYLTIDEIEIVRKVIPNIDYKLKYNCKDAYRRLYYLDHREELLEKSRQFRLKQKRLKEENEKKRTKNVAKTSVKKVDAICSSRRETKGNGKSGRAKENQGKRNQNEISKKEGKQR